MLLSDMLERAAERWPDRTAILFRDAPITYSALAAQVRACASGLAARGIGRGDAVALLLPNCPAFTVAYYGAAALGAMCVPANPLLKPAELEYIWGRSKARVVVTLPTLLEGARAALAAIGSDAVVVALAEMADLPEGVVAFTELLADGAGKPLPPSGAEPNDPAVCIFTSGTTGRPKGALLSHTNLTVNCEQIGQALQIGEYDNFLGVLPLFHSFAGTVCQNAPISCGACVTMLEQFHPGRTLEATERHGVTLLPAVPAMFAAMLQWEPERLYDLTRVRAAVSGGAPMPVPLMAALEQRFGIVVIEGDGPTECSPATSVNPLDGVRKPGSIGLPIPGVEMRIFDDEDHDVPTGEVGEIVVRGPNVMLGYLEEPEATAEAMRGGWYHTGDLGRRDADGYFYIVDRKKDMLLVGGFNVYPREVEEALLLHTAVADCAVVGAPDALRGEEVVAIVVLEAGREVTGRELIRFCRERLANYKAPRRVLFRDSLPRGGTGKVLKRLLRKELEMGGEESRALAE